MSNWKQNYVSDPKMPAGHYHVGMSIGFIIRIGSKKTEKGEKGGLEVKRKVSIERISP